MSRKTRCMCPCLFDCYCEDKIYLRGLVSSGGRGFVCAHDYVGVASVIHAHGGDDCQLTEYMRVWGGSTEDFVFGA